MAKKSRKSKNGRGKKAPAGTSVIDNNVYNKYKRSVVDRGGKKKRVVDNDDRVSVALRGLTLDEVVKAAKDNDIEVKKYPNAGMLRMNLANIMRGMVRNKRPVIISGKSIASV